VEVREESGEVLSNALFRTGLHDFRLCRLEVLLQKTGGLWSRLIDFPPISYRESAVAESDPFKWGHYQGEIILLCVRCYLRYALSYRDLKEMMRARGLSPDHTTIYRWVQAYAPVFEKRIHPHLRLTSDAYLQAMRR
jgi:hypothetical protein